LRADAHHGRRQRKIRHARSFAGTFLPLRATKRNPRVLKPTDTDPGQMRFETPSPNPRATTFKNAASEPRRPCPRPWFAALPPSMPWRVPEQPDPRSPARSEPVRCSPVPVFATQPGPNRSSPMQAGGSRVVTARATGRQDHRRVGAPPTDRDTAERIEQNPPAPRRDCRATRNTATVCWALAANQRPAAFQVGRRRRRTFVQPPARP